MKNVTIYVIKKEVLKKGGTFKKCSFYLNGNEAYEANGKTYTKPQLFESFNMGDL